jgi:hypothetical protein
MEAARRSVLCLAEGLPMRTFINIEGERFGRLIAIQHLPGTAGKRSKWLCRCDCGIETQTSSSLLRKGLTRSCGCLHRDACREKNSTHGMRKSPEYSVWYDMKRRCLDPKNKRYADYGGRGITVCERWRASFSNFYSDIGPRPTATHSIDRINNNGNYEPVNCKWSTKSEQAFNRRPKRAA